MRSKWEKVHPGLVVRAEDGKVTAVRYEAVNAMLFNEFLKEHRNVADRRAAAEADCGSTSDRCTAAEAN